MMLAVFLSALFHPGVACQKPNHAMPILVNFSPILTLELLQHGANLGDRRLVVRLHVLQLSEREF